MFVTNFTPNQMLKVINKGDQIQYEWIPHVEPQFDLTGWFRIFDVWISYSSNRHVWIFLDEDCSSSAVKKSFITLVTSICKEYILHWIIGNCIRRIWDCNVRYGGSTKGINYLLALLISWLTIQCKTKKLEPCK